MRRLILAAARQPATVGRYRYGVHLAYLAVDSCPLPAGNCIQDCDFPVSGVGGEPAAVGRNGNDVAMYSFSTAIAGSCEGGCQLAGGHIPDPHVRVEIASCQPGTVECSRQAADSVLLESPSLAGSRVPDAETRPILTISAAAISGQPAAIGGACDRLYGTDARVSPPLAMVDRCRILYDD